MSPGFCTESLKTFSDRPSSAWACKVVWGQLSRPLPMKAPKIINKTEWQSTTNDGLHRGKHVILTMSCLKQQSTSDDISSSSIAQKDALNTNMSVRTFVRWCVLITCYSWPSASSKCTVRAPWKRILIWALRFKEHVWNLRACLRALHGSQHSYECCDPWSSRNCTSSCT